eukprot:4876486-Amphidinium_carterae.1
MPRSAPEADPRTSFCSNGASGLMSRQSKRGEAAGLLLEDLAVDGAARLASNSATCLALLARGVPDSLRLLGKQSGVTTKGGTFGLCAP